MMFDCFSCWGVTMMKERECGNLSSRTDTRKTRTRWWWSRAIAMTSTGLLFATKSSTTTHFSARITASTTLTAPISSQTSTTTNSSTSLFVIELIPLLNPRRCVNLNRMYMDPSFDSHPSIYAAKSLLCYYHVNYRTRLFRCASSNMATTSPSTTCSTSSSARTPSAWSSIKT